LVSPGHRQHIIARSESSIRKTKRRKVRSSLARTMMAMKRTKKESERDHEPCREDQSAPRFARHDTSRSRKATLHASCWLRSPLEKLKIGATSCRRQQLAAPKTPAISGANANRTGHLERAHHRPRETRAAGASNRMASRITIHRAIAASDEQAKREAMVPTSK